MDEYSKYTAQEFQNEFIKAYNHLVLHIKPSAKPKAYLLGGQSGSGKSTIHKILKQDNINIIVIDGDRYREAHPHFSEIQAQYGKNSANYTQPFVNEMITSLIERLSSEKYNLIIEGTCRNVNVPLKTCNDLKQKGYSVELAFMCTDKDIAWQSTIDRYNEMKAAGITPRAVPPDKYQDTIKVLPQNISKLWELKVFDDISLYDRNRSCIYKYSIKPDFDPGRIVAYKLEEFSKKIAAFSKVETDEIRAAISECRAETAEARLEEVSKVCQHCKATIRKVNLTLKAHPEIKEALVKAMNETPEQDKKKSIDIKHSDPKKNKHKR